MSEQPKRHLRVSVLGANGRMGAKIIELLDITPGMIFDSETPEVLIDFSSPGGTRSGLDFCQKRKIAFVIGTTGLTAEDQQSIDAAAREIPLLQSNNMSLGVAVLTHVLSSAIGMLPDDLDIAIAESHHRFKKDAPSGTASLLADAIERAGRARPPIHSTRLGDEIGRHTVYLASLGERLELRHIATDRSVFARGALRAAAWLAAQKPGRYTMVDVLGMESNDRRDAS